MSIHVSELLKFCRSRHFLRLRNLVMSDRVNMLVLHAMGVWPHPNKTKCSMNASGQVTDGQEKSVMLMFRRS